MAFQEAAAHYEASAVTPMKHTTQPIVQGASILALKYKDGVMIACDTLASYGSMAKYKDVRRIVKVNDNTIMGAGGEYSDFQYITDFVREQTTQDFVADDGKQLSPSEVHSILGRIHYNRRSKVNPLWNELVVGGMKDGKPFLGAVDLYGSTYEENYIASGYGMYLAIPLIRRDWREDMTEEEAKKLLDTCLTVLFYRHCRAFNRYIYGKVDKDGTYVSEPYELPTRWNNKLFVNPSGN